MPRVTALLMLRSTMKTVSAPASRSFRGSLPHPTQPLCTLRVRRHRRLTQHSLPGGLLDLTWAGLAPADRASFAWRLLVAVGTCVSSHAPRTEPYVRLSRIRLPPRVQTASSCRMRSGASDTLIRLCARHVLCWLTFPLVPALRSIDSAAADSAADCSAAGRHIVRRLPSYYGEVRLLVPVHHRLRLLVFPLRTIVLGTHSTPMPRPEISQLPRSEEHTSELHSHHQLVCSPLRDNKHIAFERMKTLGPCDI